jgi:hypothetical protein
MPEGRLRPRELAPIDEFGLSALPGDRRGSGSATAFETKISRVRIRHSINSMNLRSPACAIYHRLNMTIHMKDAYALSKCVACRQFRMHASEQCAT